MLHTVLFVPCPEIFTLSKTLRVKNRIEVGLFSFGISGLRMWLCLMLYVYYTMPLPCKRQCYVPFSKHCNGWYQLWYILVKFSLSLSCYFLLSLRVCFSDQFFDFFFFPPENINPVKPIVICIASLYFLYFLIDVPTVKKAVQKHSF